MEGLREIHDLPLWQETGGQKKETSVSKAFDKAMGEIKRYFYQDLTAEQKDALMVDYRAGMSLKKLVLKYSLDNHGVIYSVIKERHLPTRKKAKEEPPTENYKVSETKDKAVLHMYAKKLPMPYIREKTKLSGHRIYQILDYHGIPRRREVTRKWRINQRKATVWQRVKAWFRRLYAR